MTKIIKIIRKITFYGERFFTTAAIVSLIVIIFSVASGVVSRYIFNNPLTWTEELSILMMVFLAFLSIGAATVKRKHIVADFLLQNASNNYKQSISLITSVASIIFIWILLYSALIIIPSLNFITTALKISRKLYFVPLFLIVPIMTLVYVEDILQALVGIKSKKEGVRKNA